MEAIIATNRLGYIGLNGGLPWKSKKDLQHFKGITMGKTLLVGRSTFESMPKLNGRKVIVVGKGHNTLEEALKNEIDFVIGGKRMYESVSHLIKHIHISVIDNEVVGDTILPHVNQWGVGVPLTWYEFDED
tara:strand:- start:952 stop:1344 length:393 start_codon:yes stop_codon:yes gene_type:complete